MRQTAEAYYRIAQDTSEEDERGKILLELKEGEEDFYHHTYKEEQRLLDCVRQGRDKDAIRFSKEIDSNLGRLSSNEMNHWRNAVIVAITVCTRAAI